ncbi:MAG: DUF1993 domain-containing protein [Sphingomonadaceae bacterium]|nr:DUF1993 domain-containing protein [Sphingomonadaceae bacterium]
MAITLHSYFEGLERSLATLDHILAKGAAHAAEQGVDVADMLGWRLAADMHPLSFQACVVRNFVASWVARAQGAELPADLVWETVDFATLRTAIADSLAAARALGADVVNAAADQPMTVKIGDIMEPTLPLERWVSVFVRVNVDFHLSMAYAIMRHHGVPIGKLDMFPTGL